MALFTVTCVHCNSQLRNLYKLVTAGVYENVIGLIMTLTCTYMYDNTDKKTSKFEEDSSTSFTDMDSVECDGPRPASHSVYIQYCSVCISCLHA